MEYLEGLNEKQKEAVLHTEGPLLILAGAGAGKTKTITHRILHLIFERGVRPEQILAVTFTNKASREMRARVNALLFPDGSGAWPGKAGLPFITTFHSLGVFILRENAEKLGIPKNFTILDAGDSLSVIKRALKSEGFDPKTLDPKMVRNIISNKKNASQKITDYEASSEKHPNKQNILRLWRRYEKILRASNSLDFDDLLLWSVRLLQNEKQICDKYRHFFRYIHIDEYQDTNQIQYELTRLLCREEQNICVVGDADQNIYSWRGADISNILHFERDYPGAKTVLLEENYRSTNIILKAANAVIAKNTERIPKNLFTSRGEGEKITLSGHYNEYEEAEKVAERITRLNAEGVRHSDIALLYRANFQSRTLENALFSRDIPYQVLGTKFFDRREVKDLLSYLRASQNKKSIFDLTRVVGSPPRGIGKSTLEKILNGEEEKMTKTAREKTTTLFSLLEKIEHSSETNSPSAVILETIKESGLEAHFKNKKEDGEERLLNLYELASFAQKYDQYDPREGMARLLEDTALMGDQDTDENDGKGDSGVRLMTVHSAKGLEFPYIFITGLEEDLFPHRRFGEERKKESFEEERRLFYVALTRAEKKLFLSYTSVRTKYGSKNINMPSQFLEDIDAECLDVEAPGLLDEPPKKYIFFD